MENGFVDVTSIEEPINAGGKGSAKSVIPSLAGEVQIDSIVNERGRGTANHEYLIKWKPVKQRWVDADEVTQFPELIKAYKVLIFIKISTYGVDVLKTTYIDRTVEK